MTGYLSYPLYIFVHICFLRCTTFKMLLSNVFALLFRDASLVRTVPAALHHQSSPMRTSWTAVLQRIRLTLKGKYIYRSFSSFRLPPNPFSDARTPSSPPHNSSLSELEIPHVSIVRVPNTNITLKLGVYREQIEKADLGRIILQTEVEVKKIVDGNSATLNMDRLDDPFKSDVEYNGCIFGLESYPPHYKHLTSSC